MATKTKTKTPAAAFREILDRAGYTYTVNGDETEVIYRGYVDLRSLTTLPEGVSFSNSGSVYLSSLTTLPEGVSFSNSGSVDLRSLTTLPEGVSFSNSGYVYLSSLTTLPEGVSFSNSGYVYLSSLTTLPEGVSFSNSGSVYLSSLTTLPEGVSFSNSGSVDLRSLTTLPEGVSFSNSGYVYLSSLTTLPEGVSFSNSGSVDLSSLTTLPEGVSFSNSGRVDLSSLTTLPEGVSFSNSGRVGLSSLESEQQTYRGRSIRLRHIDGYTMLIESEKRRGDTIISRARYFGGGNIAELQQCFVASLGEHHAHGATIEEALRDLRFKIAAEDFDPEDTIAEIVRTGEVERHQFRLLTGACDEGLRAGLEQAGLPGDSEKLPLEVALSAAHGSYGERFKALVREAS